MKNWLIVIFMSLGLIACGGGDGGGGDSSNSTPIVDDDNSSDSNDDSGNTSGGGSGGNTSQLFIAPDYNITSDKVATYSYNSGSVSCDLVVYIVPYQETGVYQEDLSDILEELDQVQNCSIFDRKANVISTTTELCISKDGQACSIIQLSNTPI